MIREIDSLDYSADLHEFVRMNNISRSDVCLVGSSCLAIRGLRPNNDIDLMVNPELDIQLKQTSENISGYVNQNSRYSTLGLSKHDVFENSRYYDVVEDYNIIRPEVEFSFKKFRKKEKDKADIQMLHQYRMSHEDDWDSHLIIYDPPVTVGELYHRIRKDSFNSAPRLVKFYFNENPVFSDEAYKKRSVSLPARTLTSIRRDGVAITFKRGVRLIKENDPTNLLNTFSNPIRKIKLGHLAEQDADVSFGTRSLLEHQMTKEKGFKRYDIIILLYMFKHGIEDQVSSEVTRLVSEIDWKQCIEQMDNATNSNVDIDTKTNILGRAEFARSLHEYKDSVVVEIRDDEKRYDYDRDWLVNSDLDQGSIDRITEEYTRVLHDYGLLFQVFLWPPAEPFKKEILNEISKYGQIHHIEELSFEKEEFREFVLDCYRISEQDINYISEKIDVIEDYGNTITIVSIRLFDPEMRDGDSKTMVRLKEKVRRRYMSEISIELGTVRPLIHGTDNYKHNQLTRSVISEYRERSDFEIKNQLLE